MIKSETPACQRKHVVIIGNTNVGKSSIFNALLGQEAAIVSPVSGTTTDAVKKTAELLPFGPITLIDTAGLSDLSELGNAREKKTNAVLRRADCALYVADATLFDADAYLRFQAKKLPHILVFNKCSDNDAAILAKKYPDALLIHDLSPAALTRLRERLAALLASLEKEETPVIASLLSPGNTAVLVVPLDSGAPQGRLILPQVQVIRQCLDHSVRCVVTPPSELARTLDETKNINLVITDSQIFREVAALLPIHIPLISFSMLLAYDKGNFPQFLRGCNAVEKLEDGARILVLEGCTHNQGHEDIGRKKIPCQLKRQTGKELIFDFYSGYDFPEELEGYALAIQCGGCMLNKKEISSRLAMLQSRGIPVTNYGILLAHLSGILARASSVFERIKE